MDPTGVVRQIPQGEGGEQGDPLMPLLFAVGQHGALEASQQSLREGERLVAFFDDIYTVTFDPERVGPIMQHFKRNPGDTRGSQFTVERRKCGTLFVRGRRCATSWNASLVE